MVAAPTNGHSSNGSNEGYKQTDQQIWKKINKSLLNIGVPVTPILVRRAKGVSMFVRLRASSALS